MNTIPAGGVTSANGAPSASPVSATLTVDLKAIPAMSSLALLALAAVLGFVALIVLRKEG